MHPFWVLYVWMIIVGCRYVIQFYVIFYHFRRCTWFFNLFMRIPLIVHRRLFIVIVFIFSVVLQLTTDFSTERIRVWNKNYDRHKNENVFAEKCWNLEGVTWMQYQVKDFDLNNPFINDITVRQLTINNWYYSTKHVSQNVC